MKNSKFNLKLHLKSIKCLENSFKVVFKTLQIMIYHLVFLICCITMQLKV